MDESELKRVLNLRNFRRRLSIALMLATSATGAALTFVPDFRDILFGIHYYRQGAVFGLALIGGALTGFVFLYLRGEINPRWLDATFAPTSKPFIRPLGSEVTSAQTLYEIEELKAGLFQTSEDLKDLKQNQFKAVVGDREALLDSLQPNLVARVVAELGENLTESLSESARVREVRMAFKTGQAQLEQEVMGLSRRSAVNLAIGSGITCVAASLLLYLIWGQDKEIGTWQGMVHFYVPRITAIIFVEVFGFFFLRLYRETLAEMRSCQREQINLILKYAAIETAWASSEEAAKSDIAGKLVANDVHSTRAAAVDLSGSNGVDPNKLVELLSTFAKTLRN